MSLSVLLNIKETTNVLHFWKCWVSLRLIDSQVTTIHVLRHTWSHLKCSDLSNFEFCLPRIKSLLKNGIKSMKVSQKLSHLNLSLRFPTGPLEKSQRFVLLPYGKRCYGNNYVYLLCYGWWASELSHQKSCYFVLLKTTLSSRHIIIICEWMLKIIMVFDNLVQWL